MNLLEFIHRYVGAENLSPIPWEDLPVELQSVCRRFIDRWFEETSMDDLRELSGFDHMTLDELLRRAR